MSTKQGQTLILAMSLVRNTDSIGVPIFGTPQGNVLYVPEMDHSLKIMKFLTYYNNAKYTLHDHIPEEYKRRRYNINDFAPIPFWVHGRCYVVDGGSEAIDLYRKFGKEIHENEILSDVSTILTKARNGYFREVEEEHKARTYKSPFRDIFEQEPIHSRYWVSRYADAVSHIKLQPGQKKAIYHKLISIADEWFRRFGTKTDSKRFYKMLGSLRGLELPPKYLQNLAFSYFVNKIQAEQFEKISSDLIHDGSFIEMFPHGIYSYFRENQWIDSPIKYNTHINLLDPLIIMLENVVMTGYYSQCERMAYIYFGRADAPVEISQLARSEIYRLAENHSSLIGELMYLRTEGSSQIVIQDVSNDAVANFQRIMAIEGVISGRLRLQQKAPDRSEMLDMYLARDIARRNKVYI